VIKAHNVEVQKMSKVIFVALVLFIIASSVFSQQDGPSKKSDVVLSKGNPTIYITFERAGTRKPMNAGESEQGIWLRLHNNTPWSISFCTPGLYLGSRIEPYRLRDGRGALALREGVEIQACHGVEQVGYYESEKTAQGGLNINESSRVENIPVGYNRGHVFSTSWLPPGHSVIFSVPSEHLAKHLGIYLSFKYEWETAENDSGNNEPEHRVYFRASDLPDKIRTKN